MSATMFTRSSQVSSPPPSPRIKTSPQSRSSSTDSSSSTPTSPITLPSHPHIQRSTPLLLSHALLLFLLGIPVNILLLFGCILRLVGLEKLSWGLGCWVAKSLWGWLQDHLEGKGIGGGGFGLGAGEVMTFSGDLGEVKEGEGAVVIANHQGYADYYLIHALAQRLPLSSPSSSSTLHPSLTNLSSEKSSLFSKESPSTPHPLNEDIRIDSIAKGRGMLGSCRYFAKRSLVWQVPIFGWSMWAIGMILVSRNWTTDASHIQSAFERIKKNGHPCWIVSYLEGTRLSERKIKQSLEYAKKEGLGIELERVLYPRTKGFVTTIQELRDSHIRYVYDLTLCYTSPTLSISSSSSEETKSYGTASTSATSTSSARSLLKGPTRAPSLGELLGVRDLKAGGYKFHVDLRRIEIASLPKDDAGLKAWVEEAWIRKDGILKERARMCI